MKKNRMIVIAIALVVVIAVVFLVISKGSGKEMEQQEIKFYKHTECISPIWQDDVCVISQDTSYEV